MLNEKAAADDLRTDDEKGADEPDHSHQLIRDFLVQQVACLVMVLHVKPGCIREEFAALAGEPRIWDNMQAALDMVLSQYGAAIKQSVKDMFSDVKPRVS